MEVEIRCFIKHLKFLGSWVDILLASFSPIVQKKSLNFSAISLLETISWFVL